jgi:NAD(P)-dependent dehydrogenase (short-subunit alcohol dehydrogenase family)
MSNAFAGKVVVVTGAGGNVGQAVARRFKADGATLILVGRTAEELSRIQDEVGGTAIPCDVTSLESVQALVTQVEAAHGSIAVLAHTVGGYAAGQAVTETNLDVWDKMMMLNARSVYVTAGCIARHMQEQQVQGRIMVIVSRAAYQGAAHNGAYTASKAAAQRVIESLAQEVLHDGITVNAIMPSIIDTPPNRSAMPNADFSKWVTAEEIADTMAFLALDSSRGITGASIDLFGRV